MSDENSQGGTTEQQNTESKTYTEADVQRMVQEATENGRKDGQTEAHKHFQSVTDKSISALRKEHSEQLAGRDNTIAELRKAQLATMSPEERLQATLDDMAAKLSGQGVRDTSDKSQVGNGPESGSADLSQGDQSDEAAAKQIAEIRGQVEKHLADTYGIDASKINWADDSQGAEAVQKFVDSVMSQAQVSRQESKEDDPNNVDTSNSAGGNLGFDPKDKNAAAKLIAAGAGRVRQNPQGGFSDSPFRS